MSEFFAALYETLFRVYHASYPEIFSTLYNYGGYVKLGLIFLLVPLVFWLLFYFLWRYPYGRFWHWLLWWLLSGVVVLVVTWLQARGAIFDAPNPALVDALADPESGYKVYAVTLPQHYALINTGLSLVAGFLYSLLLKPFSKIQMHLPF
jgi:energy-coupling factor transporter transmembrane protein EcfT